MEKTTQQGTLDSVLLTKYHLGYQIKKAEIGRACRTHGGEERCIQGSVQFYSVHPVLVGKREGRRPLGKPTRRWEDNIKMDLPEMGWGARTESIWISIRTDGGLL